jgi:uncharacterized protein (TIGR03066 family)
MSARWRTALLVSLVSALVGALAGGGVCWLALRGQRANPTVEQPKTTAELLVGKWKFVRSNTKPPPELQAPIEFKSDGTVMVGVENPVRQTPETRGRYWLQGDTLWVNLDQFVSPAIHTLTVASVAEDNLVTVAWVSEHERRVCEYERVSGNSSGR